ncbi:uncharacterized protein LOC119675337 [Teleopsis dalmanni]|uniref:uncharacterized protein LOC119675337 n=1 Tax=Teleopsis dalmanni TaxID=139649 RepID=UPI0018CE7639|nr:uncharacterized protein LOC119675337 [Teleopsis dalmanni]
MVTIKSLTKEQLKDFLQQQELSTTGNKVELVARLTEHVKSSGVVLQFTNDNEELRSENEELRIQISELRQMVQQVACYVQHLLIFFIKKEKYGARAVGVAHDHQWRKQYWWTRLVLLGVELGVAGNPRPTLKAINQNNVRNNQNSTSEMPSKDRNAHSIQEIAEVLPEFDPTNEDSITATQFVERVEAVMSVYAWAEKSVLLAVYSRLKGVARMWVDASPRMHATWKEFSNELVTEFGCEYDEADVHYNMSRVARRQNEIITELIFRFSALRRRHNLSEMAITKYARLKHRELQMEIAPQKFVSVKEMREACENFLQNCIKINEKPFHNAGESKQRIQSFSKAKNVMCYNCGESGHLSVNCARPPKRPRCIDCNKVHPKNEHQNCGKPSAFVRKTSIIDNKFLKKITIGGKQAIAFIDTGSECNMVQETFANDIGGTRSKNLFTIGGFGGGIERSEIQIDTDLKIDEVEKSMTLHVFKDCVLNYDLLLGDEIFNSENIRAVYDNGHFKFEDKVKTTCKINKLSLITEDDVCMDTVNSDSKGKLLEVMNEFRECFATGMDLIGKTSGVEMKIEVMTNEVIAQFPYRVPEPKKEIVAKKIQELLDNDIIAPSESSYASPMLLVKKKNGDHRLCVDYRRINQFTRKECYPIPNIEENL